MYSEFPYNTVIHIPPLRYPNHPPLPHHIVIAQSRKSIFAVVQRLFTFKRFIVLALLHFWLQITPNWNILIIRKYIFESSRRTSFFFTVSYKWKEKKHGKIIVGKFSKMNTFSKLLSSWKEENRRAEEQKAISIKSSVCSSFCSFCGVMRGESWMRTTQRKKSSSNDPENSEQERRSLRKAFHRHKKLGKYLEIVGI